MCAVFSFSVMFSVFICRTIYNLQFLFPSHFVDGQNHPNNLTRKLETRARLERLKTRACGRWEAEDLKFELEKSILKKKVSKIIDQS